MQFTVNDIATLLESHYGIYGTIKELEGYDELNFLVQTKDQKKWIVKIANASHVFSFVEAQTKILSHLSQTNLSNYFQKPLLGKHKYMIFKPIHLEILMLLLLIYNL